MQIFLQYNNIFTFLTGVLTSRKCVSCGCYFHHYASYFVVANTSLLMKTQSIHTLTQVSQKRDIGRARSSAPYDVRTMRAARARPRTVGGRGSKKMSDPRSAPKINSGARPRKSVYILTRQPSAGASAVNYAARLCLCAGARYTAYAY